MDKSAGDAIKLGNKYNISKIRDWSARFKAI